MGLTKEKMCYVNGLYTGDHIGDSFLNTKFGPVKTKEQEKLVLELLKKHELDEWGLEDFEPKKKEKEKEKKKPTKVKKSA